MGQPVVHFEVIGQDGDKLPRYYGDLFGWEFDTGNPMDYGLVNGAGIGGGSAKGPDGYEGHVTFYVEVPDVEATLAQAESLGGSRALPDPRGTEPRPLRQPPDPQGHPHPHKLTTRPPVLTPRAIQRTYLVLLLGNTLAASFIWGINTIFLLDAGLSNLEAFAANAFFTAGMVLFEVPTGIVADTIGRRASYLLGTVTLAVSTLLYVLLWQVEGPFWAWAVVSLLLGLGFTFFSGAVEAWLVDALTATGFTASWSPCSGAARWSPGRRCSTGSVAGGFIAQQASLGVPFVLRGAILIVMFVVAFRLMHDIGFTPDKGGDPLAEMRKIASASIEYGWRVPAVKWLMVESLFTGGRRHLRVLRPAAVPARALRRPAGLPDRRPGGGDRRRRADPRRGRGAADPPALPSPHLGADRDGRPERRHAGPDRRRRELLGGDRADRRLGPAVRGLDADPPDLPQRPDPVAPAGDDPLVRLADGSSGGVWAQPVLGRAADVWGYPPSYLIAAGISAGRSPSWRCPGARTPPPTRSTSARASRRRSRPDPPGRCLSGRDGGHSYT